MQHGDISVALFCFQTRTAAEAGKRFDCKVGFKMWIVIYSLVDEYLDLDRGFRILAQFHHHNGFKKITGMCLMCTLTTMRVITSKSGEPCSHNNLVHKRRPSFQGIRTRSMTLLIQQRSNRFTWTYNDHMHMQSLRERCQHEVSALSRRWALQVPQMRDAIRNPPRLSPVSKNWPADSLKRNALVSSAMPSEPEEQGGQCGK